MMERLKYSQPGPKTNLKCGKMWEFRYLRGKKTPPSAALTLGSSVDTATTANLEQKIENGNDLPVERVLGEFSTVFDANAIEKNFQLYMISQISTRGGSRAFASMR